VTTRAQRETQDTEATVFACALLMPPEWLGRDLAKVASEDGLLDMEDELLWRKMAKKYDVSVPIMAWWVGFLHGRRLLRQHIRAAQGAAA
jgi:Zn-dependent peptidase ImmA (M78 family)